MSRKSENSNNAKSSKSNIRDNVDLISVIYRHMQADDDCPNKQSQHLISLYDGSDINGKQLINDVLICVCGYSLTTIINEET